MMGKFVRFRVDSAKLRGQSWNRNRKNCLFGNYFQVHKMGGLLHAWEANTRYIMLKKRVTRRERHAARARRAMARIGARAHPHVVSACANRVGAVVAREQEAAGVPTSLMLAAPAQQPRAPRPARGRPAWPNDDEAIAPPLRDLGYTCIPGPRANFTGSRCA